MGGALALALLLSTQLPEKPELSRGTSVASGH
jgi:hypothetical protein